MRLVVELEAGRSVMVVYGKDVRGTFGTFAEAIRQLMGASAPRVALRSFMRRGSSAFGDFRALEREAQKVVDSFRIPTHSR